MKTLKNFITEKQTISTENAPDKKEVKCPLVTNQISTGLTVAIDLSQIEAETLEVLFQDSGMFWGLLDEKQLKELHNELNPSLSFKEWMKENNNFKR